MAIVNNISAHSAKLATVIADLLKTGAVKVGQGRLTHGALRALTTALKNITNPSKRSILIKSVGDAVSKGILSTGSSVAEVVSAIILPMESTKQERARQSAETQKAVTASNERLQMRAIEAGLWNSGLTGQGSSGQGQQGTTAGQGTTGSFLGG